MYVFYVLKWVIVIVDAYVYNTRIYLNMNKYIYTRTAKCTYMYLYEYFCT